MSRTFKIINSNRALTTVKSNLPAIEPDKKIQKWKRSRSKGNVVTVRWTAPATFTYTNKKTGWVAHYWSARLSKEGREAIEKGYTPVQARLHGSVKEMQERAADLQKEVVLYCQGNVALTNVRYAGTLSSLIKLYRNSEESGYANLKYNIARTYDYYLDLIDGMYGRRRIAALTRKDLFNIHKEFLKPHPRTVDKSPKLTKAHDAMRMLRRVVAFGIGLDDHCDRVCRIFETMRFEKPEARRQYLTADHVIAFIKKAIELQFPSMALAQAFQYETALRQKDVIGEWWPDEDHRSQRNRLRKAQGLPPIMTETWTSGLVWGTHVSPNLIMAKPTSKSKFKKLAISDINLCPLIMAEIAKIPTEQRTGPVIVDEISGNPYRANSYQIRWRMIADATGIPSDHRNMDSRAGAITEGSEAGVDIELLRQFGTHSEKAMTQHYNRETLVKARKVHRARNAHRGAPDESRFDHGITIDAEPVR